MPTSSTGPSREGESKVQRLLYLDVADKLIAEISNGRYELDKKLPTEAQFCERFGVSRSTVRQALGEVERAGFVERRQGSGTTLVSRKPVFRYVVSVTSEVHILRYMAETVLELSRSPKPVSLGDGRRLQLADAARWSRWEGIRRDAPAGPPIGVVSLYLPRVYNDVVKRLGVQTQRAIFVELMAEAGVALKRIDQVITASVLAEDEAERLQADAGAPAIVITRRYSTENGLFEVSESIHPADRFNYALRLQPESPGRASS